MCLLYLFEVKKGIKKEPILYHKTIFDMLNPCPALKILLKKF